MIPVTQRKDAHGAEGPLVAAPSVILGVTAHGMPCASLKEDEINRSRQ